VNANCPSLPDGAVRTIEPGGPAKVTRAPCSTSPRVSSTVPDRLAVLVCCDSFVPDEVVIWAGWGASGRAPDLKLSFARAGERAKTQKTNKMEPAITNGFDHGTTAGIIANSEMD
jgi:hypothetical protein